jgi:hypothetical protein
LADDATHDPIEPVMMALTNNTGSTIYLDMIPGGDILGGGVRLQHKGSADYLVPAASCAELLCSDNGPSDNCAVTPCTDPPAVRAILPEQTYTFDWIPYEFSAGTDTCAGQSCISPVKAAAGRYLMSACYSTTLTTIGTPQKLATDPMVISGAQVTTPTCSKTFEIGVPGYDVRYQLYLP